MKHYTETISVALAEKLKEKGMPIEMQPLYAQEAPNARGIVKAGVGLRCPSYAEVLDYLWDKGIRITIRDDSFVDEFGHHEEWWTHVYRPDGSTLGRTDTFLPYKESWHAAVNAAITKALELI